MSSTCKHLCNGGSFGAEAGTDSESRPQKRQAGCCRQLTAWSLSPEETDRKEGIGPPEYNSHSIRQEIVKPSKN